MKRERAHESWRGVEGGEGRSAGPAQEEEWSPLRAPAIRAPPPNTLLGGETVIKMMSGEENTDITRARGAFRAKI